MSKDFSHFIRILIGAVISLFMVLIAMPAKADIAGLDVQLSPISGQYDNGSQIEYTLTLTNTSGSTLFGLEVNDDVMSIITSGESGGSVNAFESAEISATASFLSSAGDYDRNGSLAATNVNIRNNGTVSYTIKAKVSVQAAGDIANVANVRSGALLREQSNTTTHQRVVYEHSIELDVTEGNYGVGEALVYELTVTNLGTAKIQGMTVTDLVADIEAEDTNGALIPAFTSVLVSAKTSDPESSAGTYYDTGNLQATDVSITAGESIIYTITGIVDPKLVGDIINDSAEAETRDGTKKPAATSTPPKEADITLTHTLNKTDDYLVSDDFSYTVKVSNASNAGIAHNYTVQQLMDSLKSDLGNDISNDKNADDTMGNPYSTWTNDVTHIESRSTSVLAASGAETNKSLNDKVSIYPGEYIEYTILVHASPVSIGQIPPIEAKVLNDEGGVDSAGVMAGSLNTEEVLGSSSSQITRFKKTTDTTYVPGVSGENEVVYDIEISNTDSKYFANDVVVLDRFACNVTEQVDGSTGSAFSEWKLEVADSSGEGSNYGSFNYGAWTTSDINLKVDLAPEGYVRYKLTAKVADNSVGQIVDDGTDAGLCLGDNLGEVGSGVQMPNSNLKVQKEVDSRYYSAGNTLNYTITLENTGDGYAIDVPVVDDLASVTTTSIYGTSIQAYISWVVTAVAYAEDGTVSTISEPGFSGEISGNQTNKNILNVTATVAPKETIIYSIAAIVNPIADGEIRNVVEVNEKLFSDRGSYPRDYYLVLDKRVDGNDDQNWYTNTTSEVTYTISVTNPEGNGFASDISIQDQISTIQAELLEPAGATKPVFSSWTISADIAAESPWSKVAADTGDFADNTDLDVIAQIPPGVTITYTIVGTLDRSVDTEILWGTFSNTATVKSTEAEDNINLSDSVTTHPYEPNLVVAKTAQNTDFIVGETATFDIYIQNNGKGYANDAVVQDNIAALEFFTNWTITGSINTDEPGSRYGDVADNENIDTDVDITPGGWVHYVVTGVVDNAYPFDQVSNRVDVYDPLTDRDHSASAQINNKDSAFDINVSLTKTTDVVRYTPGDYLEYTILVKNNDEEKMAEVELRDELTKVLTTLANDKDGFVGDVATQQAFVHWLVDTGSGYGSESTNDVRIPLSLPPGELKTIKIKALVKDNAVSNGVESGNLDLIRNEAILIDMRDSGCTTDCEYFKRAVAENHQVHNNGDVFRTTNINRYSPGDELIYTFKYTSQEGRGYRNNVNVNELVNGISVQLQDGSTGNPFYDPATKSNQFSVSVEKSVPANAGTTDGTKDGTVADNNDIVTAIDIDEGEDVTYTVKGVIRPDAVGDINYRGTIVIPNDYHLNFDKVTDETVYEPGQTITYRLIIENDGQANADDISIIDEISGIETELVDGSMGPAFTTWTITHTATGESSEYVNAGDYEKVDNDLNVSADIPMGATLEYEVVAIVNDKANGNITNALIVDSDKISHEIRQTVRQIKYEKTILAYYDVDGNKLAGATQYMPGGYVEYQIRIDNIASAHVDDISLRDDIDQITTDYYDGSRGPAFDSWTIQTFSDNSGITNPDVDNAIQDNQPINTHFDIAADNFGGVLSDPYVRYVIRAKISPKAVGSFTNRAYIDEDDGNALIASSPPSSMADPEITFNKKVFPDAGFSVEKNSYSQAPGESEVYYRILIKNDGYGTEYGSQLKDTISAIRTRIAEDNSTAGGDPVGHPFNAGWDVSVVKDAASGSITEAVGFSDGSGIDIDNDIVIAPLESLTFIVHGTIREDALGDIKNTANYDGKNSTATLLPLANNINVEKRVVSINGAPFNSGDTYIPGDEVEYEFVVTNPENGWANDVRIQDKVTDIGVKVIGGATKPAYASGDISHVVSNGIDANIDTYVPGYSVAGNLDIEVDIAAGEALTFNLTGTVRDDALGEIEANRVTADSKSASSEPIPPKPSEINYFKTLEYTDGESASCSVPSSDGSGCTYAPRGDVEYQVTLENTGDSIAHGVHVIDAINNIKTSDGTNAFKQWATSIAIEPVGSYSVTGNYSGNVPLNATVDLRPGEHIVFDVKGTVAASATGTITNTAQVTHNGVSDTTNDIILDAGRSQYLINKWTDTPQYVPGGTINYYIDITNDDVSTGYFGLLDDIASFEVETVDGSMKPALEEWTLDYEVLLDSAPSDPAANDFSELDKLVGVTNPDINIPAGSIKMAGRDDAATGGGDKYTLIRIHIQGKVRDDAIGRFTNTAFLLYGLGSKRAKLTQGYITPKPGQLELTKETTPIAEPDAKYQPGQPIAYKITLTNVGEGYLVDQVLVDRIDTIMTDVANSTNKEQALT
ncbi:hypothetical protein, partial [Vibrio campbellii]|uniref:hypothetical protein n=1 Tax=Vibrio campbellii TaxID=680 RepID=UPI002F403167